jgi:hypothetical protein
MNATFILVPAWPASSARVSARRCRLHAGPAADAGITLSVQPIEGQVMSANVGPPLLDAPACQGIKFDQALDKAEAQTYGQLIAQGIGFGK